MNALTKSMAGGPVKATRNNLRFLDDLDFVNVDSPDQRAAFSLPMLNLDKELTKIGERDSHWYEEFCCTQPEPVPKQVRRRTRAKRKPALVAVPKTNAVIKLPTVYNQLVKSDDCLLPLIPVPNPMPCISFLQFPNEVPMLPPGIRAVRHFGVPIWNPADPRIVWTRPGIVQRPVFGNQPPWAHSRTQLWNKSATLQPGWARGLVHLGQRLHSIATFHRPEADMLMRVRGEAFGIQFERNCFTLGRLTDDCIQVLGSHGKRQKHSEDV